MTKKLIKKSTKKPAAKKPAAKKRATRNAKHPTATYPRASLKLPKGVEPKRKRAASKKNPSGLHVSKPLSFTWKGIQYDVFFRRGVAAYREHGSDSERLVEGALQDKALHPAFRALLKSTVHAAREARKAGYLKAAKAAKKVGRAAKMSALSAADVERVAALVEQRLLKIQQAKRKGKRNAEAQPVQPAQPTQPAQPIQPIQPAQVTLSLPLPSAAPAKANASKKRKGKKNMTESQRARVKLHQSTVKHAAKASLEAEKAERTLAKARATMGKKNAGKSCSKNPTASAKPKKVPTKEDFARIIKLFKKYVAIFAKKYPKVVYTGLKVDPAIHDTARHMAMTGVLPGDKVPTVRVAPEMAFEPVTVQQGVLAHELSHASFQLGYGAAPKGYDANERATDKRAEQVMGMNMYYDRRDIEVMGRGARGTRPRPAGLR
jgi:hypothetical protein